MLSYFLKWSWLCIFKPVLYCVSLLTKDKLIFKTFVHLIIIQKIYTQSTSSNMIAFPQIGYSKHIIILSMTFVCSVVLQHFLVPVASLPFSCCSASLLTYRRCSGVDEAQAANMLGNQCCSPGFYISKSLMKVILA